MKLVDLETEIVPSGLSDAVGGPPCFVIVVAVVILWPEDAE